MRSENSASLGKEDRLASRKSAHLHEARGIDSQREAKGMVNIMHCERLVVSLTVE